MMLTALIANDVRLQRRYGLYYAYAFVVGFYVVVLHYGGSYLPAWVPGVIIFSDPAAVGFFFLGALMMLERAEGVRTALATTPASGASYFWSKSASLTGLALVAVLIISPFVHAGANLPLLLATVVVASVQYLGLGVPIALRFRTVTGYLIGASVLLLPVVLPAGLALLGEMPWWAMVIPAASQLRLFLVATGAATADGTQIAIMLGVSALAAAGCAAWAMAEMRKEFGGK